MQLDRLVERVAERRGDVSLALVVAERSLPLILPESEMEIGEVDEAQRDRDSGLGARVSQLPEAAATPERRLDDSI